MENKGKKLNRLYDKGTKQWFDVPADFFEKYDKERDAFRKKMQDHGRCVCPFRKDWLCDMMCDDCEFQRACDFLSFWTCLKDTATSVCSTNRKPKGRAWKMS